MNDLNGLLNSENSTIETENQFGKDELIGKKGLSAVTQKIWEKIKFVLCLVTVEPILLLYLFSYAIQSTLITNLLLEKTCNVHFKYSEVVCNNLTAHNEENDKVQTYTSQLSLYINLIESLPVIFFILYLGAWSDKNGRKLALTFPLIGNSLSVIILMIISMKGNLSPEYILLASVPKAVTGGFASLLMICYAYISDISSVKDRTMRVALIDVSFSLGPFLGLTCGGLMYSKLGFIGAFSLSFAVTLLCIVYVLAVIKETVVQNDHNILLENDSTTNNNSYYLLDALYTALKPRPNYLRAKLLIMMTALSLMVSVFQYGGLQYLFLEKMFNWRYSTYIQWLIFQIITSTIVTLVFLPVALYKLKISDILIGLYGTISRITGLVTFAFSPSVFFLYLSVILGSFGFIPLIIARAIISKLVAKDEVGKVFSLLACLEVVLPLVSQTIFTLIYNATLTTFPGLIFLIGAVIFCVVTALFLSVYIVDKRTQETPR